MSTTHKTSRKERKKKKKRRGDGKKKKKWETSQKKNGSYSFLFLFIVSLKESKHGSTGVIVFPFHGCWAYRMLSATFFPATLCRWGMLSYIAHVSAAAYSPSPSFFALALCFVSEKNFYRTREKERDWKHFLALVRTPCLPTPVRRHTSLMGNGILRARLETGRGATAHGPAIKKSIQVRWKASCNILAIDMPSPSLLHCLPFDFQERHAYRYGGRRR